jgi:hypothetical protein
MPLRRGKSRSVFSGNVRELMHAWQHKGRIGNSKRLTKRQALKRALAISYRVRRVSRVRGGRRRRR